MPTNTPTPFINPTNFAPARFGNFGSIINLIVPIIMIGSALGFLIMLIMAAFAIITGEGKPEAMTKATKIATSAIIGLAVVLSAFILIKLIGFIFKIDLPL